MNWLSLIKAILIGSAVLILFQVLEIVISLGNPLYRFFIYREEQRQKSARRQREAAERARGVSPIRKLRR